MAEIRFSCPHCGANLHIGRQFVGRLTKCPKCAQTCRTPAPLPDQTDDSSVVAQDISPVKKDEAFAVQLARAFVYPFKGSGIFLLIAATAVFSVLSLLSWFVCAMQLLKMLLTGYLCAYYISVIASSAAGEEELPDWPDFTSLWDDILRPGLLIAAALLVSFAPLLVYGRSRGSWFLFLNADLMGYEGAALVVWGLLYLPMSLVAIALFDSVAALNPVTIIGAIAKIPLRYLLACVLFLVVYLVNVLAAVLMLLVPILGMAIQIFFSLYMMLVAMRILGLIYHANARKLGWFEDS